MAARDNIYFDHNATTPLRDVAFNAMAAIIKQPLNASSIHSYGREAKKLLTDARNKIQKLISAEGATVLFTSSGTESNNMALVCIKGIETVVVSEAEHPSISKPASYMRNQLIPVDENGIVVFEKLQEITAALKGTKYIVSIIHANNETGVIQPVREIANIVFANGGFLHIDASQSVGKVEFDFNSLGCDMATISAHKFGGPKGAAALVVKSGLEIVPFIHGGSQEKYLRAGTENLAAIVGMAAALEEATVNMKAESAKVNEIREYIEKGILEISPEAEIYGTKSPRLPNTISVSLKPSNSETQLINLDLKGIAISAGSACTSGRVVTSHVLTAMGVAQDKAQCAIRISLGWNNTLEEAKKFLSVWQEIYEKNKGKKAA